MPDLPMKDAIEQLIAVVHENNENKIPDMSRLYIEASDKDDLWEWTLVYGNGFGFQGTTVSAGSKCLYYGDIDEPKAVPDTQLTKALGFLQEWIASQDDNEPVIFAIDISEDGNGWAWLYECEDGDTVYGHVVGDEVIPHGTM
jgi:hypothetical protein